MGFPPLAGESGGDATTRTAGTSGVVGVVLAGGASQRMGRDKAVLAAGAETLAGGAARRLGAVCGTVVAADRGRGTVPGLPAVADGPGRGPAAGILGAAHGWPGRPLLVLACDLPAVSVALLGELAGAADRAAGFDWFLPFWERGPEPLCALYLPAALEALAAAVERGVMALHRLTETPGLRIAHLAGGSLQRFGDPADLFLNLNTPEDLERWRARAGGA